METKDKITNVLIPNVSVGNFRIGVSINRYLKRHHKKTHYVEKYFEFDSYYFPDENLIVHVENDLIDDILCEKFCYWKGKNLIRMNFSKFLKDFGVEYDNKDEIYLQVDNRFQTQKVYDFHDLGLQIWVWRNLIRTVIVGRYEEE